MKRLFFSLFLLFVASASFAAEPSNSFNIKDFGAMGDGIHIDSHAINEAIKKASLSGGGTVVVPEGIFLCYSIHLQSEVTLFLDKGAVLKAAPVTDTAGYDEAEPNDWTDYQDFGHSHWHNSLIWGENLKNITIEGYGLIDGSDVLTRGWQRKTSSGQTTANKAVALRECKNVTLRGFNMLNCGHFALLLTGVDDLLIDGLNVDTNRDGLDIDCCEHVTIRNCRVNTVNDDAIVLKCSYALGYPKPTAHVLIEDCEVSGFDVGSLLDGTFTTETEKAPDGDGPTGRIKLGTESNGGFHHINIRRCSFNHCRGLALESVDGASMHNIEVSDITMHDICNSPIYIRLGHRMRAPENFPVSRVEGIRIKNMRVTDADSRYACLIAGSEDNPVKDVLIENLFIEFRGGITLEDVREQRGANPFFFGGKGEARISKGWEKGGYPEPSAHGLQPAWGFSISHADNIYLSHIQLNCKQQDERPWIYLDDASHISLIDIEINGEIIPDKLP